MLLLQLVFGWIGKKTNRFEKWHGICLGLYVMRKFLLITLVTIGMIGSSFSQMAIPGEVFASNPARFNGRRVTVKNIEIVKEDAHGAGPSIGGPAGSFSHGAPGPVGSPTAPPTQPCRAPRGFSEVSIFFKGAPEYKGCFFMADNMKTQLDRECGHQNTPAMIDFRGDSRMGYHITAYRLGF
jgi:hypothetical protein